MIPRIPAFGIARAVKSVAGKLLASAIASDETVNGFRVPECFDVIDIELIPRSVFAGCEGPVTDLGSKSTTYAT
jgi:hypothetical protein